MKNNSDRQVPRSSLFASTTAFSILGIALLHACGGSSDNSAAQTVAAIAPKILIIAGDIGQCPPTGAVGSAAAQTGNLVKTLLTSYGSDAQVLTLGDNAYNVGSAQEFKDCYEPTWGAFKAQTLATPGNHDYGQPLAAAYFDYFGTSAGVDRKGFYAKQFGNWSLLSLNSNIDVGTSSEQMQWIKGQTYGKCKLAAWHHPLFTSASRGSNTFMRPIWDQLDQYKFDIVFQGHEHHYEKFAPKKADGTLGAGMRSFVVGTGGASLSPFSTTVEGSELRSSTFGVIVLKLFESKYEWEFVDLQNKVLDSGTAPCRG